MRRKKKVDDKAPRVLGPADTIIHTREEGPTVQPCGDSEVAGRWIKGRCSNNTETWKAVKGFWDGSSKNNGRSGCGVVIEGVDKDKWVTIS